MLAIARSPVCNVCYTLEQVSTLEIPCSLEIHKRSLLFLLTLWYLSQMTTCGFNKGDLRQVVSHTGIVFIVDISCYINMFILHYLTICNVKY